MDSQTRLALELRYPPITRAADFVRALPDEVVNSIIIGLKHHEKERFTPGMKRAYIRIYLAQPASCPTIIPVIWDVLERYHLEHP